MLRHKSHYCTNSLSLCVRLCENCHFLFQSTYFESGVWGTCRLLFCPVSPSRGQVRSQELFSGGKQNLKIFTLRHVLAGCGPNNVPLFSWYECVYFKFNDTRVCIKHLCKPINRSISIGIGSASIFPIWQRQQQDGPTEEIPVFVLLVLVMCTVQQAENWNIIGPRHNGSAR